MERPPAPLLHSILLNLQQNPAACALCFRSLQITNAQLLQKVIKLAEQLKALGISKGDVVGIYMERCPDILVVLLALWYCEAIYLPLDLLWPHARLNAVLEQAQPRCLVSQPQLQHCTDRLCCPALILSPIDFSSDAEDLSAAFTLDAVPVPSATDLAYILFTSGSSGQAKGVLISQHNLASLFQGVLPLLKLQAGWRVLGCASFCFDIVFFELLAPLLCSAVLVLAADDEYRDPAALTELLLREQVSVVQATPALWALLLQTPKFLSVQLQLALATGEALPVQTARNIARHTGKLWNLYGPTECSIWASAHEIQAADLLDANTTIAIGKALPGYSLSLAADESDTSTPDYGELLIGGSGLGQGYLNNPEQTAQVFCCNNAAAFYKTGDCCRLDQNGTYHFIGRLDSQLKINGYRIEAEEIALRLQQHASITQAVCLARKHSDGMSSQLLAFVVCTANQANKDKQRFNRHLAQWLPEWMLPDRYFLLDHIPLNSSGKVDRQALLQLAASTYDNKPPEMQTLADNIAAIFCELLETNNIGPCDSFFDLGGNSMLSASLVLAVNEKFQTAISLREALAVPPTVSSLCKLVEHELAQL